MSRTFLILSGLLGTLAVATGTFGSYVLKKRLSAELFTIFEVATRHHMYHLLVLLDTARAVDRWPGRPTTAAGYYFFTHTIVFSGSLYLLSLTDVRWLGARCRHPDGRSSADRRLALPGRDDLTESKNGLSA